MKHRVSCLPHIDQFSLILALSAVFILSSCWHPPFDPDVSASLISAEKLGEPVWEVQTRLPSEARGGYYVPKREPPYDEGIWVVREDDTLRVFRFTQPSPDHYALEARWDFPVTGDQYLHLLPLTNPDTNFVLSYPGLSGWLLFYFTETASWNMVSSPPEPGFVGCGIRYGNGGDNSSDTLYTAAMNIIGNLTLKAYEVSGSTTDFSEPTIPIPITTLPAELSGSPGFVVQADSGDIYLSFTLADGTGATYRWQNPLGDPELLPIKRPLTGLLSDGRLLADMGDRLFVYGPDGSEAFAIPTGALHFSHERYDSEKSKWISVFTRTLEIPLSESDSGEYIISVYEIPTERLRDLAYR